MIASFFPGVAVIEWLGRASVQAAVLALLVLAVQGLLRQHLTAAWRYRLWLLVILRLVLPFSLPSDLSLFNLWPARPDAPAIRVATDPGSPGAAIPRSLAAPIHSPRIVDATSPALTGPTAEGLVPRRTEPSAESSDAVRLASVDGREVKPGAVRPPPVISVDAGSASWSDDGVRLLGWVWLGGVVILATRLAARNLRFARRVGRDCRAADARLTRLVDECRAALGVRRSVALCETGAVRSPALFGLWRPRLLLPNGLAAKFSDEELRLVLLHELSHVRRHDLPMNLLVAALRLLHWFNPVLWYAFRRMDADRELATDALALGAAGEERARCYGETILKLLEGLRHPVPEATALGILEDRAQMRDRMRRIARFRRPSRWSALAVVPAGILAVVTLTDAQTGGARPGGASAETRSDETATPAFVPVDLSKHIVTPWSTIKPGSSWDAVPKGKQTFDGVPFDLAGLVEVAGTGGLQYNRDHPTRVSAIRVGRKVAAVHLLHGAGFAVPDRTTIAKLILHFGNGQSRELPIRYGEHVRNWWDEPNDESEAISDAQTRLAWTGRSKETDAYQVTLRLYHTRFANPLPGEELISVDLVSTLSRCSEVMLGLTTEAPDSPVPAAFAAAAGSTAGGEFFPVPLKAFCTRTYEVIDQDPDSSWAYAPHGRHVFNGVLFDLPGVMEVSGLGAARDDNPLPTSIRGIPLGRKARRLHLLHGGAADLAEGTPLAKLVLHYADGRESTLRLVYGVNVRNWYKGGDKKDEVSDPNTKLGWTGDSPRSRRYGATLRIYHTAFDLPWPDTELKSLDFVSLLSESVSVVPGITLEAGGGSGVGSGAAGTPAVAEASPDEKPVATEVRVRVVDATTGKPVEGATARLRATDGRREYKFGEQRANTRGELIIDVLNDGSKDRSVTVRAPGYLAAESTLVVGPQVRELTFRLRPGLRVGGQVTDPNHRPIPGATVVIRGIERDDAGQVLETALDTVTTDDAGRWNTGSVPPPGENLSFRVSHPEFLPGEFEQAEADATDVDAPTVARLKAGNARFVIEPAPEVPGRVATIAGDTPIADAEVVVASGDSFVNRRNTRTGADGRFRLAVPDLGPARVLVQAAGFAPNLTEVDIDRAMPPTRVALSSARHLRGRIQDEKGRPVAGATVSVADWREVNLLTWRAETDAEGRFTWDSAPREVFRLVADKVGFDQVSMNVPEAASDADSEPEVVVRMGRGFVILGRAIDAETRQPISGISTFFAWGEDSAFGDDRGWDPINHTSEGDGRFAVAMNGRQFDVGNPEVTVTLMVSAPGYLPVASPAFPKSGVREYTFELRKGTALEGVVVNADGKPVQDVVVGLMGLGYLQLSRGELSGFGGPAGLNLQRTDEQGRFAFKPLVPSPRFVAAHPVHGYAEIQGEEVARSGRIVLRRWGRIEGTLKLGTRPGTNEWVMVMPPITVGHQRIQYEFDAYRARTGEQDGRFVLDRVPPGERRLVRLIPLNDSSWAHSHPLTVDVRAGETTPIVWGGTGRPVIGRMVASDRSVKVDWTSGHSSMSTAMSPESRSAAWYRTDEGRQWMRNLRQFTPVFAADGSFRIEDVPAGEYQAHFSFMEPESRNTGTPIFVGWANPKVTVPEMPGGRSDEPLDLGEIEVRIQSPAGSRAPQERQDRGSVEPAADDAARVTFRTLDHGELRLTDLVGRPVLSVVWLATNTPANLEVLKEVEALRAAFPDTNRLAVIGAVMDGDRTVAQGIIRDLGVHWPQLLPDDTQKAAMMGFLAKQTLPLVTFQSDGGQPLIGLRGDALRQAVEKALKETAGKAKP